jgi:hypothetical protein
MSHATVSKNARPGRPARWRLLLVLLAASGLLAACATLQTVAGLLNNQLVLGPSQLQAQLDRRFPRDYDQGMVTLILLNPRLSIPAGDNRLRLDMDIGFRGLGSDGSSPVGRFAVASGIRFDAATRGLHLADPSLEAIEIPRLGGALNSTGRDLVNRWLRDYARDEPVYTLDDVYARLRPGQTVTSTTIANGRVVVDFSD